MSKKVEKQFQQWLTQVHGRKGLPSAEVEGRRMAFYSGAFALLAMQSDIARANTETDAIAKMDVVMQELTAQIIEWGK